MRTFKAGVTYDLLDRPPTELFWYNPSRKSAYRLNANARRLWLDTYPVALLSLGTTSRGFTLTMTFEQARAGPATSACSSAAARTR